MDKIDSIIFESSGIGQFVFSDKKLEVPINQRPYSWEKQNIKELYHDIFNSQPKDYFIGSIVLSKKGDDAWEVVDGQQRLATITILYAAIRNYFLTNNENSRANTIEQDYVCKKDLRSQNPIQKLKLSVNDNDFFLNRIVNRPNTKTVVQSTRKSNERIEDAYRIAFSFIEEKIKLNSGNFDVLFNLIDFIKDSVKIVIVKVPSDTNAFTVFETLNDRGLDLSKMDLIKNYLFNIAESRIGEAQEHWTSFTATIESASKEEEVLNYIRYFFSSKYGLTREKELFRVIQDQNTNSNLSISFLKELRDNTTKYLALLNPNHSFWDDYTSITRDNLNVLLDLKLFQNRPLLLAILNQFQPKEIEKSFKLILSWSVRNLITGSIGSGTLEEEFSNHAKQINDGKIKTAKELKESLNSKKLIPSDGDFQKKFSVATISKSYLARYYLIEIEKYCRSTDELSPIQNPDKVNLEHILPETFGSPNWKHFDEELHQTYCRRIGNLTLMDKKMNSEQQRASFSDKKEYYKKSEITITKSLENNSGDWTNADIEKRQAEFAEKAVQIWNLKIE